MLFFDSIIVEVKKMSHTKSPLRYPGGKSQLWKFVKSTIEYNDIRNTIYCEPFAGGSGVTCELLLGNHVDEVVINDYDPAIFSFWNACINHTEELIEKIIEVPVTLEEWHRQKEIYNKFCKDPYSIEGAFATFFLNRTNRSGIISAGPIGGQEQKSKYKINCRFTKATSINKIKKISAQRNRIHLFNLDASQLVLELMEKYPKEKLFTFFDPPYYAQGQSLYLSFYNHEQHKDMRDKILSMNDYFWILTYDKHPQISDLYHNVEQAYEYDLLYSANKKTKATEFLFASPVTKIKSTDNILLKKTF